MIRVRRPADFFYLVSLPEFAIVIDFMEKVKFKIWWPATAWAILILIVSSIPNLSTPSLGFTFADKVAHFVEYLILGLLVAVAFHREGRSKPLVTAIIVCCAFGILDELHQALVPGRTADIFDILADFLGSVAGTYLCAWIKGTFPRRASQEPRHVK